MATESFIQSLHIEDNVFELKEDAVLRYLVHYAAPFTGEGQISVPAGVRFAAHGPMRGDALYMHPIEEEKAHYPVLILQCKTIPDTKSCRIERRKS